MPFMPEMLKYSGSDSLSRDRAEKICDTVSAGPPAEPEHADTVLLDDLRCDGSAHGGCQAGCRIYWKESWLRRVDTQSEVAPDAYRQEHPASAELDDRVQQGTRTVRVVYGSPTEVYRCQATDALRAAEKLQSFDPRQYVREVRSGNVDWWRAVRIVMRGSVVWAGTKLRVRKNLPVPLGGQPTPRGGDLDLQPGDLVQVRSPEEIGQTLNPAAVLGDCTSTAR